MRFLRPHLAMDFDNPNLAIGFALAFGVISTAVAHHLRMPGIVLLLAGGVLLGPDVADVIRPETLGSALMILVGFAVAVILFDGGMNLDLRRLRRERRSIRQLITLGALVTTVGGALAAKLFLGWDWRQAVLFGTLVIVTGPTVVTPLLRRLKIERSTATVLEAEGVLIDAVGAIIAMVALEVALSPSGSTAFAGLLHVVLRLSFGMVYGALVGMLIALLLRVRGLLPGGLHNIFVLGTAVALFHSANALQSESGIPAVIVAGMVVGNTRTPVQRELFEFKEQLTVLFIGMLFVLLAADVRLADVRALGTSGLLVVAALVFVVRPLSVVSGTWGSDLSPRQRAFMAWMGPRGIVAAAVASFFAEELDAAGVAGGAELRAMVFMVIALTVVLAGLTGGPVAKLLGLRRASDSGWVILGANQLARTMAHSLRSSGEEVVCIDANPQVAQETEAEGLRVIWGNGLDERTLQKALIDTRRGVIGMTPNDEVNLLFAQKVKQHAKLRNIAVLISSKGEQATPHLLVEIGADPLFHAPQDYDTWQQRFRRKLVQVMRWKMLEKPAAGADPLAVPDGAPFTAITVERGKEVRPITRTSTVRRGDVVTFLCDAQLIDAADPWLRSRGWHPVDQRSAHEQSAGSRRTPTATPVPAADPPEPHPTS